jgi:hypothetical protein
LIDNPRLRVIICLPRMPDFDLSRGGWVRTAFTHRAAAIRKLADAAVERIAAFHPIGFPGRPTAIRSTTVIIDDAWCLCGTSHWRRRGMTFDGSVSVAAFDKQLTDGYSLAVSRFRRQLMAAKLGIPQTSNPDSATPDWIRLATTDGAFEVVADLLAEGGAGRCKPIWEGPKDNSVLPQTDKLVDPDGTKGIDFLNLFASLIADG